VLAGVAGIAYGSVNSVNQGIEGLALLAFPAALLGGLDSIPGSLIGGFGIGLVGGFRRSVHWPESMSQLSPILSFSSSCYSCRRASQAREASGGFKP